MTTGILHTESAYAQTSGGAKTKSHVGHHPLLNPRKGLVTWESEGHEGGYFHSRVAHVPSMVSGLTIGRGYDMKYRSQASVFADLVGAGVPEADAKRLSGAAGLYGADAKNFMEQEKLGEIEISQQAQVALFELSYKREEAETKRISTKVDVVENYGPCSWDSLNPTIKEILVDMKFRGDYTPKARTIIQSAVAQNDLILFAQLMCSEKNWPFVPKERFRLRRQLLEKEVDIYIKKKIPNYNPAST